SGAAAIPLESHWQSRGQDGEPASRAPQRQLRCTVPARDAYPIGVRLPPQCLHGEEQRTSPKRGKEPANVQRIPRCPVALQALAERARGSSVVAALRSEAARSGLPEK